MEPIPAMLEMAARHGQYQNYYLGSIKRTQPHPIPGPNAQAYGPMVPILFTIQAEYPDTRVFVVGNADGTVAVVTQPHVYDPRHVFPHTHEQSRSLAWDLLVAADIFGFRWLEAPNPKDIT